jgi:hypothetical protein
LLLVASSICCFLCIKHKTETIVASSITPSCPLSPAWPLLHAAAMQIAAVATLFWADRKIDKARSWWSRSVTLDPDIGDHWAQLWKFEGQHGTPESQANVLAKAVAADPHHGERWVRVAKDPENAHQPVDVLLKKVVVDIDTLPPP